MFRFALLLCLLASPLFAADERARRDLNYNATLLGLSTGGEIRNVTVDDNGFLIVASTSPIPGLNYDYAVQESSFTTSVAFTGIGWSWLFAVRGGSATFTINGGSAINAQDGDIFSSEFRLGYTNPSLVLTAIETVLCLVFLPLLHLPRLYPAPSLL